MGKTNSVYAKRRKVHKRGYDAAHMGRFNHFEMPARGRNRDLDQDLVPGRKALRLELQKNPWFNGIPQRFSNACVGTGPKVYFRNQYGQDEWQSHIRAITVDGRNLCSMLHTIVRGFFTDGAALVVKAGDKLMLVDTERMEGNPARIAASPFMRDPADGITYCNTGINTDDHGVVRSFTVIETESNGRKAYRDIRADNAYYLFDQAWAGQTIGEPWLVSGYVQATMLRDFDQAFVARADADSRNVGFYEASDRLTEEMILNDEFDVDERFNAANLPMGVVHPLKPGYKYVPNNNGVPAASDFRRDVISNVGSGAGIPGIISTDASRHNFSSSRFDATTFTQKLEVVREAVLEPFMDWVILHFANAVMGDRRSGEYSITWPVEDRYSNPVDRERAREIAIGIGTLTPEMAWEEDGYDVDTMRRRVEESRAWWGKGNDLSREAITDIGDRDSAVIVSDSDAPAEAEVVAVPETEDVQSTALNGAQVQAAMDIVLKVSSGELSRESAKAMLASFFTLPVQAIDAMVDGAEIRPVHPAASSAPISSESTTAGTDNPDVDQTPENP